MWFGMLGFCGCGMPSSVLRLMTAALKTRLTSTSRLTDLQQIRELVKKHDEEAAFLIQYVLDSAGLTEHGSGIGCAWPTAEGQEFVEYVDSLESDDEVVEYHNGPSSMTPRWTGTHLFVDTNDERHNDIRLRVVVEDKNGNQPELSSDEREQLDRIMRRVCARYARAHLTDEREV